MMLACLRSHGLFCLRDDACPFDAAVSTESLDFPLPLCLIAGVHSNRSSGSTPSQHHVHPRKDSRQHSDSSTGSYSDARGTLSGRDSIMSTLAQRLTLSNLLTRKPAPDNTTRESFN
jgi:hypothetical protein